MKIQTKRFTVYSAIAPIPSFSSYLYEYCLFLNILLWVLIAFFFPITSELNYLRQTFWKYINKYIYLIYINLEVWKGFFHKTPIFPIFLLTLLAQQRSLSANEPKILWAHFGCLQCGEHMKILQITCSLCFTCPWGPHKPVCSKPSIIVQTDST